MNLFSFLFTLLIFNLPFPAELFMTPDLTTIAKTHNITVIGATPSLDQEWNSSFHISTNRKIAWTAFTESEYYENLLHEEQALGCYAISECMGGDYCKDGYRLHRTCRGDYIFVSRFPNQPIILYTQKEYVIAKPKAPRVMKCEQPSCNNGTIAHNGSWYSCGTCLEISDYKKHMAIFNKRIAQGGCCAAN